MNPSLADLAAQLQTLSRRAGEAIMEVYRTDFDHVQKADSSPLTQADLASNAIIVEGLEAMGTDYPILSEETKAAPYEERSTWGRFWVVDPLDGTKEFLKRNDDFTVNIALVEQGEPILGVVYAPVFDQGYVAWRGGGAYRFDGHGVRPIQVAERQSPLRVVGSRSHAGAETEAYLDALRARYGDLEFVSRGSSLKLCLVAEGAADLYPRLGPTMEWDTAAADAVAREAGARVTTLAGEPLAYNKPNLLNPFFLVSGFGVPEVPAGA